MKKKEVKKIIKNNPNINKNLFDDGMKQLGELKKLGIKRTGFTIDLPYDNNIKYNDQDKLTCKF